ncbi:MAG: hypothetical protein ACXVPL_02530 [Actinomycetota bacterium]
MRTRTTSIAVVLISTSLLGSCNGTTSNGPTPNGSGPAFEMTVLSKTRCPSTIDASTCVRVRITNKGTAGDGRCRLRGWPTGSASENPSVQGEWLLVNKEENGQSVVRITPWDPTVRAVGYCEPGLHS